MLLKSKVKNLEANIKIISDKAYTITIFLYSVIYNIQLNFT